MEKVSMKDHLGHLLIFIVLSHKFSLEMPSARHSTPCRGSKLATSSF